MGIEENKVPFRKYLQLLATPERLDEVVSADFDSLWRRSSLIECPSGRLDLVAPISDLG
jgi:hypothetical protein